MAETPIPAAPRKSLRPDCSSCGVRMFRADCEDEQFLCKNDNCARYGDVVSVAQ